MKVRLVLDADDFQRFVVAKYFHAGREPDRPRATRSQMRRFAVAAVKTMVAEQAAALRGRPRTTADRLRGAADGFRPSAVLMRPSERQPSLL